MKHLDGTTIRVGSICSATDLCVPVLKHTFKRLSLLYNVKVEVEHVFSVESQGYKRSFIAEAHHDPESGKRPSFHIFGDVADCMHAYIHICMHMHTHTHIYIYIFIWGSIYIYIYIYIYRDSVAYIYIYTHI